MKYLTQKIVGTALLIFICAFGAWWWYFTQLSNIEALELQEQYKVDIEKAFRPIDELNLSIFKRISDQEIRSVESIDEKGKNGFLQFRYSYVSADTIDRKIILTKQYSIVIHNQLTYWENENLACDFHVCMQYAQYVSELNLLKERYEASKIEIESELSSVILRKLDSEAYNL